MDKAAKYHNWVVLPLRFSVPRYLHLDLLKSRIRQHFLHINPACGVAKCTADEAVLQPVLDEMRAINAQN